MSKPSLAARRELQDFLHDSFNQRTLEVFWNRTFGPQAMVELPRDTFPVLIDSAIEQLAQHASADADFFRALEQARPKRSTTIWKIAASWGFQPPPEEATPGRAVQVVPGSSPRYWTTRRILVGVAFSLGLFSAGLLLGRWPSAPTGARVLSTGPLPFTPSNLDLSGLKLEGLGDLDLDAQCGLWTIGKLSQGENCKGLEGLTFKMMKQPDGSYIGVYFARRIRITVNGGILFIGPYAGALVALETMEIFGRIHANPIRMLAESSPGGFASEDQFRTVKGGPGGGSAAAENRAGSGGSFCGRGGAGAVRADAKPHGSLESYGSPQLIPLIGGSGGGESGSGSGGGAIQLVAGTSIRIGSEGRIDSSGTSGKTRDQIDTRDWFKGFGGGSGGAILLEAPTVIVEGQLHANGAAGNVLEESTEKDGELDFSNVFGWIPRQARNPHGGAGGADEVADGADGTVTPDGGGGGGGGGGAGRIRINTRDGTAVITGRLSPASTTACATLGTVAP